MPFYTTPTEVREASGFVDNTNITDAQITKIIDYYENEINACISDVYTLPLPIFYRNIITFSGTGTGSSTMTITIDGDDYAVAITSGMTALQAADAFRTLVLAASGIDFQLYDGLGHDEVVVLISNNQDQTIADVQITSTDPQTVAGITATGGTVTATPVPLIASIARGMAAGRLLAEEYGEEAQNTSKDGLAIISEYRKMLDKICEKKMKLIDPAGNAIANSETKRLAFFPTTGSEDDAGTEIEDKFTMNQKF